MMSCCVMAMLCVCCSDPDDQGEDKEYANVTLKDFERVDTLGMGGFGRVELVSGQDCLSDNTCCIDNQRVFSTLISMLDCLNQTLCAILLCIME